MLDEYGRDETHRSLWADARTLSDIGELTARWLEGGITYHPAYGAPCPDSETAELIPVLAAVNRAGFVTDESQPGFPLDDKSGQRAYVTGFCSQGFVDVARVAATVSGTDLVVLAFVPGTESGPQVVVTVDDGAEFTWLGHPVDAVNIDHLYGDDLAADGVAALRAAWQVHMFDPLWGRNELLWSFLSMVASHAGEWGQ